MIAKDTLRKLVISAVAPTESFIPMSVPTGEGFKPGGEESFSANVTVKAYLQLPWFGDLLIERSSFNNAALESGGQLYVQPAVDNLKKMPETLPRYIHISCAGIKQTPPQIFNYLGH